jgi:PAS domain S-box-containing protein
MHPLPQPRGAVPASDAPGARAAALLDAQAAVLDDIARGRPLDEVLAALCRLVEAQALTPVRAAILLVDPLAACLRTGAAPSLPGDYNAAVDGVPIRAGLGTCSAAAACGETIVTPDIAAAPGWATLRELPLALGLRAAWSMPILGSDGSVLGTFGTYFGECREPRPDERRLVQVLARTAALAIERQRHEQRLAASARRDRFLAGLAAATQSLVDASAIMSTAARRLAEHLDVDRCAYAEVEGQRVFVITGDWQRGVPSIVGRWEVAAFGAECLRQMLAGEPFVVADAEADPRIGAQELPAYRATAIRAVICVPLHKHGRFTAAMAVHQTRARRWTADEIELVGTVVGRCWESLERAAVARTLQDSEARYRAMVEGSPDCVALVGADGVLLQVNAAGLDMIGTGIDAVAQGRCNLYERVAPEHRTAFVRFNEAVCDGHGGELAFDLLAVDGSRRSMEATGVPLPAPGGGCMHLSVARDVSGRMAAERALARNRSRLDYAVQVAGIGFWHSDLPLSELIWDERVRAHLFVEAGQAATIELFLSRVHPEDREAVGQSIDRAITTGGGFDVVYRSVDPAAGAIKWIHALGGVRRDATGTPAHFDGVSVDVTAQKLDQQRLALLLENEREQARLLRKVAEAARTIQASGSLEGVLRVIAEQARAIIGAHQSATSLTVNDDHAQSINTVSLSDKYREYRSYDAKPTGAGIYALVCRQNQTIRLTQQQIEQHPAWRGFSGEAGRHPPLRGWLAVPLLGSAGTNLGLVQLSDKYQGEFTEADEAILMQLAQIAAVALENARLYERLLEQDRRKDEFLAMLAHELRNPLAPILTGLHVLRVSDDAEQAARVRGMMDRQVRHLVRMVDDLLDVSRITRGKVALRREPIDLRSVLHSAIETARPSIDAGRHAFSYEPPALPLQVDGDPTRLSQVVANLLNNAAKYTPPGGRIRLQAGVEDGHACIRVSDDGIGIPADMLERVFDMFAQVGGSIDRAQGGLGIGLTLVRRLVDLHGGRVSARSPGAGQGSTFSVRLPLLDATAEGSD